MSKYSKMVESNQKASKEKIDYAIWTIKEMLEKEGHTIIQKGRKNIRYFVKDYENKLYQI